MSKNKIVERRMALEAALKTVEYQIEKLQPFYSVHQVRIWKQSRRTLREKLKHFRRAEKLIQQNAKRLNYSNSEIPKR